MIGTLGQMVRIQSTNIYTHKVKKARKQEKAPFENIIRIAAAELQHQRFEFSGRFASAAKNHICKLVQILFNNRPSKGV